MSYSMQCIANQSLAHSRSTVCSSRGLTNQRELQRAMIADTDASSNVCRCRMFGFKHPCIGIEILENQPKILILCNGCSKLSLDSG